MKLHNNILKSSATLFMMALPLCGGGLLTSCVDTIILPDDKTVEEDFWKTKSDVQSMVNGAYSAMASADVQKNLIVWSCRSDELNVNTSLSNSTLNQFDSNNLQTDNTYNKWGALYSVINTCNLVLSKSDEVRKIDPNYQTGDHNNTVAQMTALRSLCYFYLVRAFRDVPLVLEPFKESSQELNVPQTAGGVIMDQIISDLENVKNDALSTDNVTETVKKYGCFTRNSIYALLADCYLWRASVTKSLSDYRRCVELCNMVRDARGAKNSFGGFHRAENELDDDGYNLSNYKNYCDIFAYGNTSESLLELQFTNNEGLCNCYYMSSNKSNAKPWFYTSAIYGMIAKGSTTNVFNQLHSGDAITDIRGFASAYNFNNGGDEVQIRKYIGLSSVNDVKADDKATERAYGLTGTNWIVYRCTDVMLMKAEAMVQIATMLGENAQSDINALASASTLSDSISIANRLYDTCSEIGGNLVTAMRQVQIVNTRAQKDGLSVIDSTAYAFTVTKEETADYARRVAGYASSVKKTCEDLEIEVMNERARELCFEGKRWHDMLRYNYRHTETVNYNQILADIANPVATSADFLALMARKYTTKNGNALVANVKNEACLYMPVSKSEIEVNELLKQNPAYKDKATAEKNY